MTDDLLRRAEAWLVQCGSCDYGIHTGCTCPQGDYRAVMSDLVDEVITLRRQLTSKHQLNTATGTVQK